MVMFGGHGRGDGGAAELRRGRPGIGAKSLGLTIPLQNPFEHQQGTGEMKEAAVSREQAAIAHRQSAEVAAPPDRALDEPALAPASEFAFDERLQASPVKPTSMSFAKKSLLRFVSELPSLSVN